MALLAACASTNFLTSTTWALVDSTSLNNSEAANAQLTTSYVTSSTFTPGAITIDGIGVKLANRTGTTGTITVALDQGGSDVAGTIVTINCSDLPAATTALLDGGWIFFKFAAPVLLLAATLYSVKAKTSSSSQVTLFASATTNWSRYLRTTTTQAPVAGDDMIIAGEWTAAATVTARTVTMNETAATDYGANPSAATGLIQPGIAISSNGTLTFKDTSAANPYLRLSNSLIVYNGGTLNDGTTGTPIPRDSTSILEFDCNADGDFGLIGRNGSTINIQGLSRTVGKNIVSSKLTLDMPVGNKLVIGTTGTQGLSTNTNVTIGTGTSLGVDGNSLLANGVTDSVTNAYHSVSSAALTSTTNQKHFCSIWIARGTGTNNRYVRLQFGNTGAAALTNGFFADFDLSAVTASAYTNVGTGSGDGTDVATITAVGAGFLCTISGIGASGAQSNIFGVAACNGLASPSYAGDTTQNFIYQGPKVFQLTYTPTITIATPGVVTVTAHGFGVGAQVVFTTTGALPTGITASTTYYVCGGANLLANTFTIATSLANAQAQPPVEIATSGSQSGTHTLTITAPTGTLTVADDTGWLSGDTIAVASTSRTNTDSEPLKLTSNATSTTLPCTVPLTGGVGPAAHSGSSPTQAEVILLTRNVKIRGVTPTLMSYVQFKAGAAVDIDWAEFYYIGVNANPQKGIDVEVNTTAATNFSMQFSSIHDTEALGFNVTVNAAGGTLTSLVFSSNTMWMLSTTTGPSVQITGGITATNWTMDSNVLIRNGNSHGFNINDIGGTFTTNTAAGTSANGFQCVETIATFGTFSGLNAHSCVNSGFLAQGTAFGTVSTCTIWRNGTGLTLNAQVDGITFDGWTLFGNLGQNYAPSACQVVIKNCISAGDTLFPTLDGINCNAVDIAMVIDNSTFSVVSGIFTAHGTADIQMSSGGQVDCAIFLRNCILASATEVGAQTTIMQTPNAFVSSEKHDQTAGNHKTWMKNGVMQTDTTIFNAASPSMRMTPNSASLKLRSASQFRGMQVAITSGASVNVAVYIRKSAVGDGAAYNGNQPRLIQLANPALGQNSDVVLATYSAGTGSWNQISGTSSTATDDGVWEFVVDCDGTAGWINVDDWSHGNAEDVRGLKYWFNGLPADWVPPSGTTPVGQQLGM